MTCGEFLLRLYFIHLVKSMKTAFSSGRPVQFFVMILACGAMLLKEQAASAAPSVVGLWRFNEGAGTNALDSSGLGNNGTLTGENGNIPAWVSGQPGFGGALWFTNDGSDHAYVTIPGNGSLQIGETPTNAWTITAWAYEDTGGTGT